MILEATAAAAALLGARQLAHHAILRGLRAPRVRHALAAAELPVAPEQVREVQIPGPQGRRLFGWLVLPLGRDAGRPAQPAPAVVVLHGWGANAAMMWPVVPPLHQAGCGVLLLDARLLAVAGEHDLREPLAPHAQALVDVLASALSPAQPTRPT